MIVRRIASWLVREIIMFLVRLMTGVRFRGALPTQPGAQHIYFANHTSIGDFLLIWTVLPAHLRRHTRTVAARDHWDATWLRRFIARDVFNALLISRNGCIDPHGHAPSALDVMADDLQQGKSLIIFPEGTRNTTDAPLMSFKAGLYHLSRQHPSARFVPVWLDNARQVMPKGVWLPVPMGCSVHVGRPMDLTAAESAEAFLLRAQGEVLALRPSDDEPVTC